MQVTNDVNRNSLQTNERSETKDKKFVVLKNNRYDLVKNVYYNPELTDLAKALLLKAYIK